MILIYNMHNNLDCGVQKQFSWSLIDSSQHLSAVFIQHGQSQINF